MVTCSTHRITTHLKELSELSKTMCHTSYKKQRNKEKNVSKKKMTRDRETGKTSRVMVSLKELNELYKTSHYT
jgi:hypothetical protein